METPELNKVKAVAEKSQAIGAFLDWLFNTKNVRLAVHHEHTKGCYSGDYLACGYSKNELEIFMFVSVERLLAEYFQIDLSKVDAEKDAVLAEFRQQQNQRKKKCK